MIVELIDSHYDLFIFDNDDVDFVCDRVSVDLPPLDEDVQGNDDES